jgi:hypothetical protein
MIMTANMRAVQLQHPPASLVLLRRVLGLRCDLQRDVLLALASGPAEARVALFAALHEVEGPPWASGVEFPEDDTPF